jgi:hypothetical protein
MSVNRNPRNHHLMSQIGESNPFKKTVAAAFDIASDFERDMEALGLNRKLSAEGKQEAAQGHLRLALRSLRDLKKPIEEFHAKTEAMRATAKLPTYDKTDFVAAMNRRELRDRSCQMTFGQRAMHMTGDTRSIDFLDAVFEQPAWVSGIDVHNPNELQIYEEAKQSRLQDIHGPLLATIGERDRIESEALMIPTVLRNDIASDCGLSRDDFEAVAKVVESKIGAPWLKRFNEDGREVIRVVDLENHAARIASPDEVRDGKYYRDHAEFLADRAA